MLLLSSNSSTNRKGPIYKPGQQRHDMYRKVQPSVMIECVPPLVADGIAANLSGSRFLPYGRARAVVARAHDADYRLRFGFGAPELDAGNNGTLCHEFEMEALGPETFSAGVVFCCPHATGSYAIETSGGAIFGTLASDPIKLSVNAKSGFLQFWLEGQIVVEYATDCRDSVTRRVLVCYDKEKRTASIFVGDEPPLFCTGLVRRPTEGREDAQILIGNAGIRTDDPFVGDLKALFIVNGTALADPRQQRLKTISDVWLISVMRGAPPDVSAEDLRGSDYVASDR